MNGDAIRAPSTCGIGNDAVHRHARATFIGKGFFPNMPGLNVFRGEPAQRHEQSAPPARLEHPEHLRPHRHGSEKQAQRGQSDSFFQD